LDAGARSRLPAPLRLECRGDPWLWRRVQAQRDARRLGAKRVPRRLGRRGPRRVGLRAGRAARHRRADRGCAHLVVVCRIAFTPAMDTPHHAEAAPDRRASNAVTAMVGLAVVALALVFVFSANVFTSDWYAFFKWVHVTGAVLWVGGGLTLTILALRAERSSDPAE